MVEMKLASATSSDMTNAVADVTVNSKNTDGAGDQKETEWSCSKWAQYWGYFNEIAELKSAILMKAIWNVGKGFTADPETTVLLDHISGIGCDTFEDVLFNMEVVKRICGDSYAEIIRDEKTGMLLNLKPLDPSTIKIIVNDKGIIKRYEQMSKITGAPPLKFKPEEILHFSNNRLADQIHGISDIDSIEKTILAENESFTDIKKIMHHQAKPFILWKLKTDDTAKIAQLVSKIDQARNLGEDMFIPDDDEAISYEVVQVNTSAMVLAWREDIRNKFYRALGLPLVIFGQSTGTESGSKVEYLAHENVFEHDQRFIEKQIWAQLNLRINLIPPTSMAQDLQSDQAKDGAANIGIQPSDTIAAEGK